MFLPTKSLNRSLKNLVVGIGYNTKIKKIIYHFPMNEIFHKQVNVKITKVENAIFFTIIIGRVKYAYYVLACSFLALTIVVVVIKYIKKIQSCHCGEAAE